MCFALPILWETVHLFENNDEIGRPIQIWFLPRGRYGFQILHPLVPHASLIIGLLLVFDDVSDLSFHFRVSDDYVGPRFGVSTTWTGTWMGE